MKCNDCDKTAKNQFIIVIDNKKKTLYLCNSCATERGLSSDSAEKHSHSHEDSFGSNIVLQFAAQTEEEKNSTTCEKCGTSYSAFKKAGRLGCGTCYTTFSDLIDDLLVKIHGSSLHAGKTPSGLASLGKQEAEVKQLRKEMDIAISNENFEKAAKLRDQIKVLEDKNGN